MSPESKIFSAIPKIMSEVGPVGRNKTNKMQGFKYRGIDDVVNALSDVMARHGVFVVPKMIARKDNTIETKSGGKMIHSIITYEFKFYATDGSFVECALDGEAMDTGDKATGKCASYALKYALCQVFNITTEDMRDPDEERPELKQETNVNKPIPPSKPKQTNDNSFVIPAGKYSGKKFTEIEKKELEAYITYLRNADKKSLDMINIINQFDEFKKPS